MYRSIPYSLIKNPLGLGVALYLTILFKSKILTRVIRIVEDDSKMIFLDY